MPTRPSDDLLMQQFIRSLVGDGVFKVTPLRLLWFEACRATMIEIKQRVSGPKKAATRRLSQPELMESGSRRKQRCRA